jgi:hypothetical protein
MSDGTRTVVQLDVVETDERVANSGPAFSTRFRWRAEARARKLNGYRWVNSYRWAVVRDSGRFHVVAFQNLARSR